MKDLIDHIDVQNKQMLEKDIILHLLLHGLVEKEGFRDNYAFKGGTCLTKCYLGYYRFSEDLDFTYVKQEEFEGKTQKEVRRILSKKINAFADNLAEISKELKMDFKAEKDNTEYIEIGGSNKFVTFKVWYDSVVMKTRQFIKIQINYLEMLIFPLVTRKAISLAEHADKKEIVFLFPEYAKLLESVEVLAYDLKEIMLEKVRAILTRRAIKARDFIDLYLVEKKMKVKLEILRKEMIQKIEFMLRYEKYIQNLSEGDLEKVVVGEEEKLMLVPLDKGFKKGLPEMIEFLRGVEKEINKR